jgi:hypothetical protein
MEMSQDVSREYQDIFEDGRLVTIGRPFLYHCTQRLDN